MTLTLIMVWVVGLVIEMGVGYGYLADILMSKEFRRHGARLIWLSPFWPIVIVVWIFMVLPELWRIAWGKDNSKP